jgi:TonB family protein
MSDKEKNIIYTAGDIEQYISGKLSPRQMHAMEKAALDDPFLAEAMEGYEGMKDTGWKNQLTALQEEIAQKGSVAKVIPLHKAKNNWWKTAAAIFILGAGTALTFVLTKNNTHEKNNTQIAQTTGVQTYSDSVTENTLPATVTESLNPTASAPKEDIIAPVHGPVVKTETANKPDANFITEPGAPQINPVAAGSSTVVNDDNVNAVAPPVSNDAFAKKSEEKRKEEIITAKSAPASKPNTDAVALSQQRSQVFTNAKREATLNNFFTAQVVANDNTPLPFTNISIKKENFGTYADAKGMVRLVSTDSVLNIEVRSVGYLPKTFVLRNNQAPTKIVLQEDEVAQKDKIVIGRADANSDQRSRRARLLTDSAVNVEPADGWENYNTYVANNLDIPEDLLKRDIRGEVELSFDVRSNGTISNIRINKSLGAEYDEAAKRLILEGPQWKVKKGRKTSASIKVQF